MSCLSIFHCYVILFQRNFTVKVEVRDDDSHMYDSSEHVDTVTWSHTGYTFAGALQNVTAPGNKSRWININNI